MICGRYVPTFAEGNMGMLQGVSLNAPYEFHWLFVTAIDGDEIVCRTAKHGGRELRLPIRRKRAAGEASKVTVEDPLFGPQEFEVAPFLSDHAPPLAPVGRNAKRQDPQGLGPKDEHAVTAKPAGAQPPIGESA